MEEYGIMMSLLIKLFGTLAHQIVLSSMHFMETDQAGQTAPHILKVDDSIRVIQRIYRL